jgi:midasin
VLEPNGILLISEKGVGFNNEPEVVGKHSNFRIFMTLDPKHGEITRAMRNRCIELSISMENYSDNDMRKIVYSEVRESYLV